MVKDVQTTVASPRLCTHCIDFWKAHSETAKKGAFVFAAHADFRVLVAFVYGKSFFFPSLTKEPTLCNIEQQLAFLQIPMTRMILNE